MSDKNIDFSSFKHSLYFITPIVVTLIITVVLSFFTMETYYKNDPIDTNIAPVEGEGADAGLLNAGIFIIMAFVGGLLLLLLLRKGYLNLVEKIFALIMGYSAFAFTVYFIIPVYWMIVGQFLPENLFWITASVLNYNLYLIPGLISAVFVSAVLSIERFKSKNAHNFLMIYMGSQLGTMFGIYMPTLTVLIVLLGLSVYDIYAVFWGPLKAIFQPEPANNRNHENNAGNMNIEATEEGVMSNTSIQETPHDQGVTDQKSGSPLRKDAVISLPVYQTSRISIGLGDFVFFSMLISHSVTIGHFQGLITPFILSFTGITIGTYITFRLLEKKDILPALPVPVFLGVLGFVTGFYLLGM
ncbi:MAG: hypothetical protein ACTSRU_02335 [Candidatus Hodarchaeales archaeon]